VADPIAYVADLLAESPPPARGILSQTLYDGDDVRLVLFGFAPGEELSEHTAARPAVIHVLAGEADAVIGGTERRMSTGTWVHLPARTPHSILARTPLTMALYLLPAGSGTA
jgi:quercetin dioxygenase-like cupin family protein